MPARATGRHGWRLDPESRSFAGGARSLCLKVRPDTILTIPVSVAHAAGGVTVAAVDVRHLNRRSCQSVGWWLGSASSAPVGISMVA
ncbi:MAG: hypothetical protein R3D29_11900 [Nitratireductor sp.]